MEKLKTYWFNNRLDASVQIIGHVFFAVYFLLAFIFFKERTIFIDTADFSFELIQNKTFVLPFGRWGSVFSQALPILALKQGCSLSFFLKAYSLSIAFFYYIVYWVVVLTFKNNRITIIYLLTLCLAFRNTFYFSISELAQGLALCVVVYGLLKELVKDEAKNKWVKTIVAVVIIGCLYYFHQLLLFAVLFALLSIAIYNNSFKNKHLISVFAFTIIWYGTKILLLSADGYEGQKMPGVEDFTSQLPNLFQLPSFNYFIQFLKIEMWWPLVVGSISLLIIFMRKKNKLGFFMIGYILAYALLIVITYYRGEAPNMYEQYYILFGFFLAIIMDISRENKLSLKYVTWIILPLLIFSSARMYMAHEMPSKRIFYLEQLVKEGQKYDNKKYMTQPNDIPWDYVWVHWAIPQETILLSSLEGKQNTVTCFVPKSEAEAKQKVVNGQILAESWLRYPMTVSALNKDYFTLPYESTYLQLNKSKKYADMIFKNIADYSLVITEKIDFEKEGNFKHISHSGNRSLRLNDKTAFSKSIKKNAKDLITHDHAWVKASVWVYPLKEGNNTKLSLICSYNNDGESYNYMGLDMEKEEQLSPLKWNKVEMNYFAGKPISDEDVFSLYVWFRGGDKILIDDLKLEVYHFNLDQ